MSEMKIPNVALAYQESEALGASPVGVVVLLYNRLVQDIHDAVAAMKASRVEDRSAHVNHALLILQQLQGRLDFADGGESRAATPRFLQPLSCQVAGGANPPVARADDRPGAGSASGPRCMGSGRTNLSPTCEPSYVERARRAFCRNLRAEFGGVGAFVWPPSRRWCMQAPSATDWLDHRLFFRRLSWRGKPQLHSLDRGFLVEG